VVNYYETLNLPNNATVDQIKDAYKRLIKLYHPDFYKEPDARDKTDLIITAKNTLLDPNRRAEYDNSLKSKISYTIKKPKKEEEVNLEYDVVFSKSLEIDNSIIKFDYCLRSGGYFEVQLYYKDTKENKEEIAFIEETFLKNFNGFKYENRLWIFSPAYLVDIMKMLRI